MPRRFVFSFAAGIAAGAIIGEVTQGIQLMVFASFGLVAFSWSRSVRFIGVFLFAVAIGAWRTQVILQQYDQSSNALVRIDGSISGVVMRQWDDRGALKVQLALLQHRGQRVVGTVQMTSGSETILNVGQKVVVNCRWEAEQPQRRLRAASQNLIGECRYPDAIRLGVRSDHWRAWLARARSGVVQRIDQMYHAPQSDLLAGILLGVQESMPRELREGFRATGTSHIVALSGFNVTLIIATMSTALGMLVGRRGAFWPLIGLVTVFVVMTGASASVTRAGVMAFIVLVSQHLGRPVAMFRILLYAFIGMVLTNPLIVRYDLGFQLSFLATIGLVYVSGALGDRWHGIPAVFGLRENFASTLSAMMVTEPLLLWTFGRLSIVAPLVNLVVLPFIPLIMMTGAVSLLLPAAGPVTDSLLRLVLGMIGAAATWPIATVPMPWWAAGGLAALCGYYVLRFMYDATKKTFDSR